MIFKLCFHRHSPDVLGVTAAAVIDNQKAFDDVLLAGNHDSYCDRIGNRYFNRLYALSGLFPVSRFYVNNSQWGFNGSIKFLLHARACIAC